MFKLDESNGREFQHVSQLHLHLSQEIDESVFQARESNGRFSVSSHHLNLSQEIDESVFQVRESGLSSGRVRRGSEG